MDATSCSESAPDQSTTVYLTLFGSFQAKVGDQILPALNADKAIALLVYLIIEKQVHRREILASLFWPEMTERRARENLSQAIYTLRKAFGASFVLTDARTAKFNPAFSLDCDLWQLDRALAGCSVHYPTFAEECQVCWDGWQRGMDAIQDEFLAGFSLPDCPEFEAWLRTQRSLYIEQKSSTLKKLVHRLWQQKKSAEALVAVQKVIKLDPYDEEAQLLLLQLLVHQGQRNAALAAFGRYRQLLQTELDSQPTAQLLQFHQQILTSTGQQTLSPSQPLAPQSPIATFSFVGRIQELSRLHACLGKALSGLGQIIFVTGEAGFGKSALLQAFAEQAQSNLPNLLVAKGNCNAYTGVGDPYLPMREILACLTGDVEAQRRLNWLSSYPAITWHKLSSLTIQSLIESAPDLVGTLLTPAALLIRGETVLPEGKLLEKLRKLVAQKEREKEVAFSNGRPQSALFDQVTRLLGCLTHDFPLLLLLDDLQWADMGTVSLLFHMARNLQQNHILIVGAFRPSEVMAAHRGDQARPAATRHPLEGVYFELQRLYGDIELALDAADGQTFVEDLLERQPNHFGADFRHKLYQYTQGNALFTIELLHSMQERGALRCCEDGTWEVGTSLDWNTLPPRIEGVIAQRISRLPEELREALTFASVEGESFHAEIVAAVQQVERRQMVRWFSSELDRQHGLVALQGIEQVGGETVARYRFRHILFQKYLYHRLDVAERTHLHGMVGSSLEAIYHEQPEIIETLANELARHYEGSMQWLKAAEWLLVSGKRAYRLSAVDEAIEAYVRGVTLLENCPDTIERHSLEVQLLNSQGIAATPRYGLVNLMSETCYKRAAELAVRLNDVSEQFRALRGLALCYRVSRRYNEAMEIGASMLRIAEVNGDLTMSMESHGAMGSVLHYVAQFGEADHHLALSCHYFELFSKQIDLRMRYYDSCVNYLCMWSMLLWKIGYPDRAIKTVKAAYDLACQYEHPHNIAFALYFTAYAYYIRRDPQKVQEVLSELKQLAVTNGLLVWQTMPLTFQGYAFSELGEVQEGFAILEPIFGEFRTYLMAWGPAIWVLNCVKRGDYQTGLAVIEEVLQYNELTWLPELYRLKGKLLLAQANEVSMQIISKVEACFQQAVTTAQKQGAKSWELRAATSLAKLWQRQGRVREALDLLTPVYGWFTEGFDTFDLQKAQRLLHELGEQCR